jgi:hypothetical protein
VCHIRFAMMTPTELSKLLLRKLINLHTEYFVGRMAIAMSYHSGQIERVEEIRNVEGMQFTPRLYKTDIWGLSMTITDFDGFENYRSFAGNFFSQSNLSECQEGEYNKLFNQIKSLFLEFSKLMLFFRNLKKKKSSMNKK